MIRMKALQLLTLSILALLITGPFSTYANNDDIQQLEGQLEGTRESLTKLTQDLQNQGQNPEAVDGKKNMSKLVATMLRPFQSMSEQEVKNLLLNKIERPKLREFLNTSPRALNFLTKVLRHPNALPDFAAIVDQRSKLYMYGGFVLFTFFFNMIIKAIMRSKKDTLGSSLRKNFIRFLFMNGLRLGAFVFLFQANLLAMWWVFRSSFLV